MRRGAAAPYLRAAMNSSARIAEVSLLFTLLLSAPAPAARLHEAWGGPGARGSGVAGSRYETVVTLGDTSGNGARATLEWLAGGAVVASEDLVVPRGGHVRRATPEALSGRGAFLVRVVSDEPIALQTETRNQTDAGTFGLAAAGFRASETLSAGDVARFDGAAASGDAASFRSNVGLLCLPDLACEAAVVVTTASGEPVGEGTIRAEPRAAAQDALGALVPAAAGREGLRVSFRGVAGRFRPYLVRNDNRTSDGLLVPGTIDRTDGSTFVFPLACRLGADCWIANYQDRDDASGLADYGGGAITYDRHDGTDFLVNGFAAMDLGVDVYAAAAGVVALVDDGHPDRCVGDCATPENVVLLGHADRTATAYVHLRKGSILVKEGDVVRRGQKIAEVGSSGNSTDPHLHFSWFRLDPVRLVDPFTSPADGRVSPWEIPIPYQGFDGASIVRLAVSASGDELPSWSDDPPTGEPPSRLLPLFVWIRGVRFAAGSAYRLDLVDPAGHARTAREITLDDSYAYGEFVLPIDLASGAAGTWEARVYEGPRLLTRRLFAVR